MWDLELVLFDSPKDVVFRKILLFGNILCFPGINWAQNWTKTVRAVSPQSYNFGRFFKQCIWLMIDYLWSKFQQNPVISGEQRA